MRLVAPRSQEPTDLYFWICIFVPSPHLHDLDTSPRTTLQSIYSFTFRPRCSPHTFICGGGSSRLARIIQARSIVVAVHRPSISIRVPDITKVPTLFFLDLSDGPSLVFSPLFAFRFCPRPPWHANVAIEIDR